MKNKKQVIIGMLDFSWSVRNGLQTRMDEDATIKTDKAIITNSFPSLTRIHSKRNLSQAKKKIKKLNKMSDKARSSCAGTKTPP